LDIKPVNMEELTEVITAVEFHPEHCNTFLYSSSKGTIKIGDMRAAALCDQHAKGIQNNNSSLYLIIISFKKKKKYIYIYIYINISILFILYYINLYIY